MAAATDGIYYFAIPLKRDAFNAKLAAALPKLRGPVASPHAGQIREQHAFAGQVFEQVQRAIERDGEVHQHGMGKTWWERSLVNGTKYFATADLLEIAKDRSWLVKMTTAISTHWQKQNSCKKPAHANG